MKSDAKWLPGAKERFTSSIDINPVVFSVLFIAKKPKRDSSNMCFGLEFVVHCKLSASPSPSLFLLHSLFGLSLPSARLLCLCKSTLSTNRCGCWLRGQKGKVRVNLSLLKARIHRYSRYTVGCVGVRE